MRLFSEILSLINWRNCNTNAFKINNSYSECFKYHFKMLLPWLNRIACLHFWKHTSESRTCSLVGVPSCWDARKKTKWNERLSERIKFDSVLALLVSDAFPIRSQECICDRYTDGVIRYGNEYTNQILFAHTRIFGDRSIEKPSQYPWFTAACQRIQQQFFFTRHIGAHISLPHKIPHIICAIFDGCAINNGPFIWCDTERVEKTDWNAQPSIKFNIEVYTYLFVWSGFDTFIHWPNAFKLWSTQCLKPMRQANVVISMRLYASNGSLVSVLVVTAV